MGKVGGVDLFLRHTKVVGNALKSHDAGAGVERGESGAPIAVAGLSDGAGIDEVVAIGAQRPVGRFRLADGAISGTVAFTDIPLQNESALQMGVAKKSDGDGIGDEGSKGVADTDQVLVFVEGGAVHELEAGEIVYANGALRKRAEPCEVFRGELVARPKGSDAGDGVEIFQVHEAADRFVVIPANKDGSEGTNAGDDFVRIGAVTDAVAQVDDEVVRRSSGEAGVERLEVAMNVAEEKDTHSKARIIA